MLYIYIYIDMTKIPLVINNNLVGGQGGKIALIVIFIIVIITVVIVIVVVATGTGSGTPPATPPATGSATPPAKGSATPPATGSATPPATGSATPPATGSGSASASATPPATGSASASAAPPLPVDNNEYLNDLIITYGDGCPSGYDQAIDDMRKGGDGKTVRLCAKKEKNPDSIITGLEASDSDCGIGSAVKTSDGYDADLRKGAKGDNIRLCASKSSGTTDGGLYNYSWHTDGSPCDSIYNYKSNDLMKGTSCCNTTTPTIYLCAQKK